MNPEPEMASMELPDCPKSGSGVHRWMYHCAWLCRENEVPIPEAVRVIRQMMTRPETNGDEVTATVANVYATTADQLPPKEKWPAPNPIKKAEVCGSGFSLVALREASSVQDPTTEQVLSALFAEHELLCCGWDDRRFDTRPLAMWQRLDTMRYMVPSPMSRVWGKTKAGHPSKHSLDNTGPRRFIVCEFDSGTLDEHACLARELSRSAPLVLCVFSGGKSLHSWFNVAGWEDSRLRNFFNYAVSLGADRALWLRSQFTRIPGGTHKSGAKQVIHYFNPKFARTYEP